MEKLSDHVKINLLPYTLLYGDNFLSTHRLSDVLYLFGDEKEGVSLFTRATGSPEWGDVEIDDMIGASKYFSASDKKLMLDYLQKFTSETTFKAVSSEILSYEHPLITIANEYGGLKNNHVVIPTKPEAITVDANNVLVTRDLNKDIHIFKYASNSENAGASSFIVGIYQKSNDTQKYEKIELGELVEQVKNRSVTEKQVISMQLDKMLPSFAFDVVQEKIFEKELTEAKLSQDKASRILEKIKFDTPTIVKLEFPLDASENLYRLFDFEQKIYEFTYKADYSNLNFTKAKSEAKDGRLDIRLVSTKGESDIISRYKEDVSAERGLEPIKAIIDSIALSKGIPLNTPMRVISSAEIRFTQPNSIADDTSGTDALFILNQGATFRYFNHGLELGRNDFYNYLDSNESLQLLGPQFQEIEKTPMVVSNGDTQFASEARYKEGQRSLGGDFITYAPRKLIG